MFIPTKLKMSVVDDLCAISCQRDKIGNLFYVVEFSTNSERQVSFARFKNLSSALDFVENNLK